VATIETDKIDVSVNSTESGILSKLFANIGDTVKVGGNLFEVQQDATQAAQSTPMPTVTSSKAAAPTPKSNIASHVRIPLIKFLGPRNFANFQFLKAATEPLKPIPAKKTASGAHAFSYESIYDLPKKYQTFIDDGEMEAVEVI
jgi:pyruvate/2-oxoglutarate dehydrogenase complex dihydrolipoamide acyltransferase (E2) component